LQCVGPRYVCNDVAVGNSVDNNNNIVEGLLFRFRIRD